MLKAKDFRRQAREALKGKWIQAGIAGLIAGILGGTIVFAGYTGSGSGSSDVPAEGLSGFSSEFLIAAGISVLVIILLTAVVCILLGSIVGLGYAKFNLALFDNEEVSFKMIFSERGRYKDCFKLYLLMLVFIGIGYVLFVIPGVILTYSYMLAPYIMLEHPEMTAKEVLAESKKMMKGNKWRLFCMTFSFIGWNILSSFTFGIGNLALCPYMEAAGAAFYKEVKAGR